MRISDWSSDVCSSDLSSQTMAFMSGRPVMNAIVWLDRRTAEACRRLKAEGNEPIVQEKTGLLIDPYFSATKLAWMLDRDPALRARAERGELAFGTVDAFLLPRFTGGRAHATDATNASRTPPFAIVPPDGGDGIGKAPSG